MDLDRLRKLGFDLSTGYVYRSNKVWGTFNASGALLDPDGEDLVARLEAGDDPAAPPATPDVRPRAGRKPKTEAKPKEEAAADDGQLDLSGLNDLLPD